MKIYRLSGVGPRKRMEDVGITRVKNDVAWSIVCDGIGGESGGEVAARICATVFDQFFKADKSQQRHSGPFDMIRKGLLHVIGQYYEHATLELDDLHMGCAVAVTYIKSHRAYLAWAGDVRIFLLRKNKIIYKSIPHNPFFDRYRKGELSLRNAENLVTNVITRAVSIFGALPELETKCLSLQSGDRVLMGTDGMWHCLDRFDFSNLAAASNLLPVWKKLKQKIKAQATDNYWGVVIEV